MASPLVSVVMSVRNGERFLREAVESILDQTFREFEFIIIDDGSTDCSGSMLDSYQRNDSRVRVFHQENRGLVMSLNRGVELARGTYIARMDADDVSLPHRIAVQVAALETNHDLAAVGGAAELIDSVGNSLGMHPYPAEDEEIRSILFQGGCPLLHPAVVFRREAIMCVGRYRKAVVHAEDYDLFLRLAEKYQFANVKEVVLQYRRHSGQVSIRKFKQQALSSLAARFSARARHHGTHDPLETDQVVTATTLSRLGVSEREQAEIILRHYLTTIRSMYDAGERQLARELQEEVLRSVEWSSADRSLIADLYLLIARQKWIDKEYWPSMRALAQAVGVRPVILGRPVKHFVRRAGFTTFGTVSFPVAEKHGRGPLGRRR